MDFITSQGRARRLIREVMLRLVTKTQIHSSLLVTYLPSSYLASPMTPCPRTPAILTLRAWPVPRASYVLHPLRHFLTPYPVPFSRESLLASNGGWEEMPVGSATLYILQGTAVSVQTYGMSWGSHRETTDGMCSRHMASDRMGDLSNPLAPPCFWGKRAMGTCSFWAYVCFQGVCRCLRVLLL